MASTSPRFTVGRIRTNPVLCFEDWVKEYFRSDNAPASRAAAATKLAEWSAADIAIPPHAIKTWEARGWLAPGTASARSPTPRVVGLLYDPHQQTGLVNPLVTQVASQIACSPLLPFTSNAIQSLLIQLCEVLAPQIPGSLPEALGFDFRESIGEQCFGNSIDVAAVLSALDAVTGQTSELFTAACAVVEPGPGGTLMPVGQVSEKLDAFVREYQRGSLLVASPSCSLDERFRSAFDTVWNVASVVELAEQIGKIPGIVSQLTRTLPIGPFQVGCVLSRLRYLEERHEFNDVVRLCERIEAAGFGTDVVLYDTIRVRKHRADALRHLGRYKDCLQVEDLLQSQLKGCGTVISSQELMEQAVNMAAAFIDACDFAGALKRLESWLATCGNDPQRFSGQMRVALFNTAGRAMVMLRIDGWESLFQRSIGIQAQVDRASIRRTEGYLIEGYLRSDRLAEADRLLARHEEALTGDSFADGFTQFYRCDLERRRGNVWPGQSQEIPARRGYIGAFAQQAAARQRGRDREHAIRLLERAEQALHSCCQDDHNILRLIAGAIALTRAGMSGEQRLWRESREWIRQHVRELGEAQWSYFGGTIDGLGDEPSRDTAERLLLLLPYI